MRILQDGNTGLLNLALEARTMRAIQRLTQTYLTLSLAHIAENVGLPSAQVAEQHILRYKSPHPPPPPPPPPPPRPPPQGEGTTFFRPNPPPPPPSSFLLILY